MMTSDYHFYTTLNTNVISRYDIKADFKSQLEKITSTFIVSFLCYICFLIGSYNAQWSDSYVRVSPNGIATQVKNHTFENAGYLAESMVLKAKASSAYSTFLSKVGISSTYLKNTTQSNCTNIIQLQMHNNIWSFMQLFHNNCQQSLCNVMLWTIRITAVIVPLGFLFYHICSFLNYIVNISSTSETEIIDDANVSSNSRNQRRYQSNATSLSPIRIQSSPINFKFIYSINQWIHSSWRKCAQSIPLNRRTLYHILCCFNLQPSSTELEVVLFPPNHTIFFTQTSEIPLLQVEKSNVETSSSSEQKYPYSHLTLINKGTILSSIAAKAVFFVLYVQLLLQISTTLDFQMEPKALTNMLNPDDENYDGDFLYHVNDRSNTLYNGENSTGLDYIEIVNEVKVGFLCYWLAADFCILLLVTTFYYVTHANLKKKHFQRMEQCYSNRIQFEQQKYAFELFEAQQKQRNQQQQHLFEESNQMNEKENADENKKEQFLDLGTMETTNNTFSSNDDSSIEMEEIRFACDNLIDINTHDYYFETPLLEDYETYQAKHISNALVSPYTFKLNESSSIADSSAVSSTPSVVSSTPVYGNKHSAIYDSESLEPFRPRVRSAWWYFFLFESGGIALLCFLPLYCFPMTVVQLEYSGLGTYFLKKTLNNTNEQSWINQGNSTNTSALVTQDYVENFNIMQLIIQVWGTNYDSSFFGWLTKSLFMMHTFLLPILAFFLCFHIRYSFPKQKVVSERDIVPTSITNSSSPSLKGQFCFLYQVILSLYTFATMDIFALCLLLAPPNLSQITSSLFENVNICQMFFSVLVDECLVIKGDNSSGSWFFFTQVLMMNMFCVMTIFEYEEIYIHATFDSQY